MVAVAAIASRKVQMPAAPVAASAKPVTADDFDGYGLARPSTPAMQRAAAESDRRDEREWRELADLAACPEWGRCADAGSIEMALAHD